MSRQMNILLVEDDDLDAMMVKRTLAKVAPDATTIHARDGIEALDIIDAAEVAQPYFVLLDINMPRMNGHEFLRKLRSSAKVSDSVVFMFTTSDNPQDISLAYRERVNGYIVKPNSSEGMKEILQNLQGFWTICEPPESGSV